MKENAYKGGKMMVKVVPVDFDFFLHVLDLKNHFLDWIGLSFFPLSFLRRKGISISKNSTNNYIDESICFSRSNNMRFLMVNVGLVW